MAIVLSETSWGELWDQSYQQSHSPDPADATDEVIEFPPQLAQGYKRNISLRQGIDLTFHRYRFQQDLTVEFADSEEPGCLEWVFNLSSPFKSGGTTWIGAGQHILFKPSTGGRWENFADEPRVEVDLHLEPQRFKALIDERFDALPAELQHLIDGNYDLPSPVQVITSGMQQALQQMLNCPYQGSTKQMYLEAKSLELLVLWLEQAIGSRICAYPSSLCSDDIDRIHRAREILFKQSNQPPSLLTLARQVGLNDCTLKRGFRQVFGTTVFGCLHDYRMNQARQLLQEQRITVQEVARQVGYASPSSFHAAFRKKFGANPGTYLVTR